jgi:hypothetical protein
MYVTVFVKSFALLALAHLDNALMPVPQHESSLLHIVGLKFLLRPETLPFYTLTANALFIAVMAIQSFDL